MALDHLKASMGNQASGNMGGNFGLLPSLTPTSGRGPSCLSQAHLRSHSGANASAALAYAPTAPEYTIPPHLFRVLLLERLQLPLPCLGSHMQWMPSASRRSRTPQSFVHSLRQSSQTSTPQWNAQLARICPRDGSSRPLQRLPQRHEHQCRCRGRQAN